MAPPPGSSNSVGNCVEGTGGIGFRCPFPHPSSSSDCRSGSGDHRCVQSQRHYQRGDHYYDFGIRDQHPPFLVVFSFCAVLVFLVALVVWVLCRIWVLKSRSSRCRIGSSGSNGRRRPSRRRSRRSSRGRALIETPPPPSYEEMFPTTANDEDEENDGLPSYEEAVRPRETDN